MKNKSIKSDILLLGFFLAAGLLLMGYLALSGRKGAVAEVSVSGKVLAAYALDQDCQVEIEGANAGRNYLTIQNNEAYLTDASCPDKLCVHMGHISKDGQSIICLPNEVVVRILSDRHEDGDIDFVTGGNH